MNPLRELLRQNRVTVAAATVVLLLVAFVLWNYLSLRSDLRLEAIRKAGYPVTLAELDAWYPAVPDAQNAALVYTNAFALLEPQGNSSQVPSLSTRLTDLTLPPRGEALPAEDEVEILNLLATNQAALRLLHSAAALEASRYPVQLREGAFVLLPHLGKARLAVLLLCAESQLHSAHGENALAVQSLTTAGRLADSLKAEPLLISQLVRIACWNVIYARLQWTLNAVSLTDEQLGSLQQLLREAEQPQAFARGLAGEQAMGLAYFTDTRMQRSLLSSGQSPAENASASLRAAMLFDVLKLSGQFEKDKAFFLEAMATNLAIAEAPYPMRFKLNQQSSAGVPAVPGRFYIISHLLLPRLSSILHKDADHAARVRVAQAALAVERYRRVHAESLPDSLAELVPAYLDAPPLDPIDGQPLRFTKLAKGYVIYSIGSDGKDNGGTEPNPKSNSGPSDITLIVER
jgi:hypothetical protein